MRSARTTHTPSAPLLSISPQEEQQCDTSIVSDRRKWLSGGSWLKTLCHPHLWSNTQPRNPGEPRRSPLHLALSTHTGQVFTQRDCGQMEKLRPKEDTTLFKFFSSLVCCLSHRKVGYHFAAPVFRIPPNASGLSCGLRA